MVDRISAAAPNPARPADDAPPLAQCPLAAPSTSPEDVAMLIARLNDACDAAGQAAKGSEVTLKKERQDKARQDHLDAVKHELEEEAKRGSGFFGSLGSVVRDAVRDTVTLHAKDLLTDAEDNVVKAANSKQFYQDLEAGAVEVAKWGAVAASTAVAIATCGSASAGTVAVVCAVAGASLSAAAAAESEGHFLQKAGVGEKTDNWLVMGGSFGGAGVSAVGGFAAGSQMTGATASAVSRQIAQVGAQVQVVDAGADVAGGVAHVAVAKFDSDLEHAKVETKAAEMRHALLQRIVKDLSADLKELQQERDDNQQSALATQKVVSDATHSLLTWRA